LGLNSDTGWMALVSGAFINKSSVVNDAVLKLNFAEQG